MKSPELKDRLEESEKLIQEMTVTWEEKLRKTEEIAQVCIYFVNAVVGIFLFPFPSNNPFKVDLDIYE